MKSAPTALLALCLCLPLVGDEVAKKKFKEMKTLAEKGDAEAQNNLGSHYFGSSSREDKKTAIKWWRKAAEQGHLDAHFNLGTAYVAGSGVEKNADIAVQWFRKAAENSDVMSQAKLGKIYWHGDLQPKDKIKALAWFIIAVKNGAVQFGYFEFLEGIPSMSQINKELTPEKIKKAEALVEEMVKKNPKLLNK
tara:strand:+ start:64 stop:642 length:579 start_codon:yes stop_codon:yes gene_type:complete